MSACCPQIPLPPVLGSAFLLRRNEDLTGVSGTGYVAEGYAFADGTTVMRWLGDLRSTAIYASLAELNAIHGHNGATVIEFLDDLEDRT